MVSQMDYYLIYPTRPYKCVTWLPGCEQAREKKFPCAIEAGK
jgi:hypothetical protein